ncbi:MAG: M4 family metallopeptidase, partial [Pseudomonadota bacterium]|nr:M4 family metallopeptidase [Pseudomonadota bacterium]
MSPATETARFLTAAAGQSLYPNRNPQQSNAANAMGFLKANGDAFGITNPDQQLKQVSATKDELGYEHIKYQQVYQGLPVFAGNLIVHFDAQNTLYSVNGITVPDINVDPTPKVSPDKVGQTALAMVALNKPDAQNSVTRNVELMVFRSNLIKGTPGANHLAYQVTVSNGSNVNEKVYIDAHTGKFIDQITGIHRVANNGLKRGAYDVNGDLANLPIVYPSQPVWLEGQALPTGNLEIDRGLQATKETYNLFKTAFNYLSYDNKNGRMDIAINWDANNAFAIGVDLPALTTYGFGNTVDDVVGHEWTHNYTALTDALVYQYQPGALNESISDIVGETVDRINSDGPYPGVDEPNNPRTSGACTILGGNEVGSLVINSPANIVGTHPIGAAQFGSQITTPFTGTVMLVNDGVDVTTDACEVLINPSEVAGKIALIDRRICEFSSKVKKAQDAGAIAVIVVNNAGDSIQTMGAGVEAGSVTIPSVFLGQSNGQIIKNALSANNTVAVTINPPPAGTDNSVRWLLGEGESLFRDMSTPTCFANAGKVSDSAFYTCSVTADAGGVHSNSGISNHAYALLTDGGTYNNQTIRGLG